MSMLHPSLNFLKIHRAKYYKWFKTLVILIFSDFIESKTFLERLKMVEIQLKSSRLNYNIFNIIFNFNYIYYFLVRIEIMVI